MSETLKLNLGCGNDYKEGYVNIDCDKEYCTNGVDRIEDMRCMDFEPNSVDEILAEGCLEHLSYRDVIPTLLHWFNILKAGGKLTIETPNLARVAKEVAIVPAVFNWHPYETLYGGQRNRTEVHLGLWTYGVLESVMLCLGYKEIYNIPAAKNLDKGNDWNLRITGKKLYNWSFPTCAKCNKNEGRTQYQDSTST